MYEYVNIIKVHAVRNAGYDVLGDETLTRLEEIGEDRDGHLWQYRTETSSRHDDGLTMVYPARHFVRVGAIPTGDGWASTRPPEKVE